MKQYDLVQMGVDYYPEHWDESMWESDIRLMKETGVKVVRVAEFAWSRLEIAEGNYQFGWLDRALDLFHKYELQVVIGTPTATPPRWLTTKFTDVLPVFAKRTFTRGFADTAAIIVRLCANTETVLLSVLRSIIVNIQLLLAGRRIMNSAC
ncbi:beta-galactosidase [Paenibacillus sp. FSL F4-0125]|uniref:beta-galactosidase n=1 Tax=Paenibacillus sp. FSL F4-0125 TaxID=2954730 RepID=UPI0030F9DCCB